jgi:uncharacterized OB-fold protein
MTAPLDKPKPRNPVRALRLPTSPPGARSLAALRLTAAAAEGRFELQTCHDCRTVQYPPRSACVKCLSHRLEWRAADGAGELISETLLHHSNELYYRERVPLRQGLVRLDAGPTVLARLHGDCPAAPARVRVRAHLDKSGQAALVALPPEDTASMMDDPMLREMTSDPKFRKVLVTDGKNAVGQATAKAFVEAGADIVWIGIAEPWKQAPGLEALKSLSQVEIVPLDVTDEKYPDQHGRVSPHQDDRGSRHRDRARRDRGELSRAAAPGAGVRAGDARAGRRGLGAGDRLGQPPVDPCPLGTARARHVLGLEGCCLCAVAEPARRDASRRHPRGQRVPRPDR